MPVLYQRKWNGVDLLDVAAAPGRMEKGVPSPAFYAEYYRRLRAAGDHLPAEWWAVKERNTKLLARWISAAAGTRDPRSLAVLSVGAGLGAVELPLIEQGYRITLHEVQDESLAFAVNRASQRGITLDVVTGAVAQVGRTFDLVYLGTCEYCVADPDGYKAFLSEVRGAVARGGRVTALDFEPGLRSYVAAWLAPVRNARGIRWGRLRSAAERTRAFASAGLEVTVCELYNEDLNPVSSRPRLSGRGGVAVLHATRQD